MPQLFVEAVGCSGRARFGLLGGEGLEDVRGRYERTIGDEQLLQVGHDLILRMQGLRM